MSKSGVTSVRLADDVAAYVDAAAVRLGSRGAAINHLVRLGQAVDAGKIQGDISATRTAVDLVDTRTGTLAQDVADLKVAVGEAKAASEAAQGAVEAVAAQGQRRFTGKALGFLGWLLGTFTLTPEAPPKPAQKAGKPPQRKQQKKK